MDKQTYDDKLFEMLCEIADTIVYVEEVDTKDLEKKHGEEAYDQGKKEIKAHGTISIEEMDKRLSYKGIDE